MALALLAAGSAFALAPVPTSEAQRLLRELSNLSAARAHAAARARRTGAPAADQVPAPVDPRRWMELCAELPSCAEGCGETLNAAANVNPAFTDAVLQRCVRAAPDAHEPMTAAGFSRSFARYVAHARQALAPSERKRLDARARELGLLAGR